MKPTMEYADLDRLPWGSVIDDRDGDVWVRREQWECLSFGSFGSDVTDIECYGPYTLLKNPDGEEDGEFPSLDYIHCDALRMVPEMEEGTIQMLRGFEALRRLGG